MLKNLKLRGIINKTKVIMNANSQSTKETTSKNLSHWTEDAPLIFKIARWWTKYAPRGKGWVPRKLGRLFCKGMTSIIWTRAKAQLAIDPNNLEIYCDAWAHGGTWDSHVLDTCLNVLKKDDIFYDIGASAGIYSIEVAKVFNDTIIVHAFEPQPSLTHCIRISVALNSFRNVHVHEILLGNKEGITELYIPNNSIKASLIPSQKAARTINCSITTLDSFIAVTKPPHPTIIKIDVEGAEMNVFYGAKKTLETNTPVIILEADENMQRFNYTHASLFNFLCKYADYTFYFISKDKRISIVSDFTNASDGNYLALPPSRKHTLS